MAELGTLARPYAKAVFETALEKGALARWSEQLSLASELVGNDEVSAVLNNPSLSSQNQADIFNRVCGDKTDESFKNLVNALADNKRIALFPEISQHFERMKEEQEKTLSVEIISAFPLSQDMEQRLIEALQNKLSRQVEAITTIDESLIGGVLVRAGDMVIDGSAKSRLDKLAETMGV